MPGDHRLRLYDQQCMLPTRPAAAECDPEQSVKRVQLRPLAFAFQDGDLLSEGYEFQRDGSTRPKESAKSREQRMEKIEQLPL